MRLNVELDKDLYAQLTECADKRGNTISYVVRKLVEKHVADELGPKESAERPEGTTRKEVS